MNRLGFKVPEIIEIINSLKAEGFSCVLAMHFANADADHPLNEQQKLNSCKLKRLVILYLPPVVILLQF